MLSPIIISLAVAQPLKAPVKLKDPYTFKNIITQEDLIKDQNEKILKIMFKQMIKENK